MDAKTVLQRVKSDRVMFINLQFTDILGSLKEVTTPVRNLRDILTSGAWFDGSSVEGFARIHESDLYLKPDPGTYSVIPWLNSQEGNTARLICDIYRPDGTPFEGDPRFILKKTLKKAHGMDLSIMWDLNPNFFSSKTEITRSLPWMREDTLTLFRMRPTP